MQEGFSTSKLLESHGQEGTLQISESTLIKLLGSAQWSKTPTAASEGPKGQLAGVGWVLLAKFHPFLYGVDGAGYELRVLYPRGCCTVMLDLISCTISP